MRRWIRTVRRDRPRLGYTVREPAEHDTSTTTAHAVAAQAGHLSAGEIEEWLRLRLPDTHQAGPLDRWSLLALWLHRATTGHPACVRLLLDELTRQGLITLDDDGRLEPPGRTPTPYACPPNGHARLCGRPPCGDLETDAAPSGAERQAQCGQVLA